MKTTVYVFFLLLIVIACRQHSVEEIESEDIYISQVDVGSEKDGFQKLYKNDQLIAIGHSTQGKKNGFWKFYRNKKLYAEGHLDRDVKYGFWKVYYPNGQVKSEGHYDKGIKYGFWKYYKTDGTAQEKRY